MKKLLIAAIAALGFSVSASDAAGGFIEPGMLASKSNIPAAQFYQVHAGHHSGDSCSIYPWKCAHMYEWCEAYPGHHMCRHPMVHKHHMYHGKHKHHAGHHYKHHYKHHYRHHHYCPND